MNAKEPKTSDVRDTVENSEATNSAVSVASRAESQRTANTGSLLRSLIMVKRERLRQEELRELGKFAWTCASRHQSNARKLAVLAEEFGEVAREVTEEIIFLDKLSSDPCEAAHIKQAYRKRLLKELVQVAAVCCAWVESLEEP